MCKPTSSSSEAEAKAAAAAKDDNLSRRSDDNNTTTSTESSTTIHEEHEGRSSRSSSTATIRFAQHDMIYEIPHIDDLTDDEIQDVWLSPNEMKQIKQECITLIKIMGDDNNNIFEDTEDKCCTRGLDQHTKRYMERRRIENAIRSETVFKLQPFKKQQVGLTRQSSSMIQDDDDDIVDQLIGDMCRKYSTIAVTQALKRAKRDAKEAKIIHKEDFVVKATTAMSPNATTVPKQKKTKKKKTKKKNKKKMTSVSTSSSSNSFVQKTNKKRKIQINEEFDE